jgi:hypothetical protein
MSSIAIGRRYVDLGAVFKESGRLLRLYGLPLLLINMACLIPAEIIGNSIAGSQEPSDVIARGTDRNLIGIYLQAGVIAHATIIASAVGLSMLSFHTDEQRARLSTAVIKIFPHLPALIALSWITGLATAAAAVLFIIPGLIVLAAWLLALPSAIYERKGISESLGRSADLTRGVRWVTFGMWLIMLVIGLLGGAVAGGILGVAGLLKYSSLAGSIVGGTLTTPILAAYFLGPVS